MSAPLILWKVTVLHPMSPSQRKHDTEAYTVGARTASEALDAMRSHLSNMTPSPWGRRKLVKVVAIGDVTQVRHEVSDRCTPAMAAEMVEL